MDEGVDIAVVGAGAAGLMAAIWAGRTLRERGARGRVVALDGAAKLGAKILVAGGGRCNVTHYEVDERAFAGSSPHAIRKVLGRFDVPRTVDFFRELGVELKREDTGKLFPTTDDAHTVLNALLGATRDAGAELRNPWRVQSARRDGDGFVIERAATGSSAPVRARRVIIASGGKSLPRTGSDGHGYEIIRSLGHTVTPTWPGLVPLTLPKDHWICGLSGVTVPATVELRGGTGKRLRQFTNSTLCTHFGLSGPSVLDMSRYFTQMRQEDTRAALVLNWLPGCTLEQVDESLLGLGKVSPGRFLQESGLPERLARSICTAVDIDAGAPGHALTRDQRRALAAMIVETPLPVTSDRGYTYAEVTAGGVPLNEINLDTMESRVCPGLYLCGEICDVDGRIGGFNFQWAWASGHTAGVGAARSLAGQP